MKRIELFPSSAAFPVACVNISTSAGGKHNHPFWEPSRIGQALNSSAQMLARPYEDGSTILRVGADSVRVFLASARICSDLVDWRRQKDFGESQARRWEAGMSAFSLNPPDESHIGPFLYSQGDGADQCTTPRGLDGSSNPDQCSQNGTRVLDNPRNNETGWDRHS